MSKKITSFLLSMVLVFSLCIPAFAAENSYQDDTLLQESSIDTELVSYDSLPDYIQAVCSPASIIYKNSDGGYDIYSPNESKVATNSIETYAPDGGSWTDFTSPDVEGGIMKVVGLSYIPQDVVAKWLAEKTPGFIAEIRNTIVGSLTGSAAVAGVIALAADFGFTLPSKAAKVIFTTVSVTGGYVSGYIFDMKYHSVKDASQDGDGIMVTSYVIPTNPGTGIVKVYESWSNNPYVITRPYGGSTWHPGKYFAAL